MRAFYALSVLSCVRGFLFRAKRASAEKKTVYAGTLIPHRRPPLEYFLVGCAVEKMKTPHGVHSAVHLREFYVEAFSCVMHQCNTIVFLPLL